jgi:AcrR family transcriptional regulator
MASSDTSNAIINAATVLFKKYGFEKTSMDDIAKTAHKAKGSLYYHFKSKEDIFKAIIEREIDYIKSGLKPIVDDKSLSDVDKINKYIQRRMELMNHCFTYQETLKNDFVAVFGVQNEAVDRMREKMDDWERDVFIDIMEDGIDNGNIDSGLKPTAIADMLVMVLKSLEVQFFVQNRYSDYKRTFDQLISFISNGLSYVVDKQKKTVPTTA